MEHSLSNPWTIYVTKQRTVQAHEKNVKEWEDRLTTINTINTVESFWSIQNNLRSPADMVNDSGDFYMFRDKILPEWEDSSNEGGGRWVIFSDFQKVENTWLLVQLSLIGNMFEDLAEFICGAELAVRPKKRYKIAIWIKNASNEITTQIGHMVKKIANISSLEFQKHKGDGGVIKI